jgi:RNA polymerase primary sigma factor
MKKPILEDNALSKYLNEIAVFKGKGLSIKEEYDLYNRIRKGDHKAEHALAIANLKFVVSVAKNYQNQGVPIEDLISIGNIGLLKAAKRFDARKNFKFISYAVWWIRQSILQALSEQSRVTCIPLNQTTKIATVRRAVEKLTQKYHRRPLLTEIAEEAKIPVRAVEEVLNLDGRSLSLDQSLPDSKQTVGDFLKSDDNVEQEVMSRTNSQEWVKALNFLPYREKEIIMLYFGFNDHAQTLGEIGRRLGITRERVRQIKDSTIESLKKNSKMRDLLQSLEISSS